MSAPRLALQAAVFLAMAAALPSPAAHAAKKSAQAKPARGNELLFVAHAGWTAVSTERQAQVAMTEWVPAGQSKESHSEMITLLAFAPSVDVSPTDWVGNLKSRFESQGCKAEVLPSKPEESLKSFALRPKLKKAASAPAETIAVYECAKISMSGMARAMKSGKDGLFVIQHMKKKPDLRPEDREEMTERLIETASVVERSEAKSYDRDYAAKLKKKRSLYRLSF